MCESKKTILVTGASRLSQNRLDDLRNLNYDVAFLQHESDELPVAASEIEAVMCNSLFMYHSEEEFTQLKLVQATSAGLDRFPIDSLASRGVRVEPARGVYSPAIAEFVLLLILQIYKKSAVFFAQQKQHKWVKQRSLKEMTGLTACIVGYGSIGRAVASRLKPFQVKIDVIGRSTTPDERYKALTLADIVILTAPLTLDTYHLMDGKSLSLMKKGSVLINVSRGKLIDESALIQLLDEDHFGGVALDVFEEEPLDGSSPLWNYDKVIITPHNSFVSDQSASRLLSLFIKNVSEIL